MPTGKVKWYSVEKGFGFITAEDGAQVFLHASALPDPNVSLKPGTRVDFAVADGRKGPQALSVEIEKEKPSLTRARRRKPRDMVAVVEDLIKLLDASSDSLRRGRYPSNSKKIAQVLRALAEDFDA